MKPGQKPPRSTPTVNGITLGPGSPLLSGHRARVVTTVTTSRRALVSREFPVQAGLLELLLGPLRKGDRVPGNGMTGRFPELLTIYAIPNGAAARSKAAAGRRKAEGQLRGMPDLCLPCARGAYHALYLETKRPGGKAREQQEVIHQRLREQGNCVLVYDDVQLGLDLVVMYLTLPYGGVLQSFV